MIAIYKITNKKDGRQYIGQTNQSIEKRFRQHSKAASPLGKAMRAADNLEDDFTSEVIETCESIEQAKIRERFWIRALKCKVPNGYNRSNGGESPVSNNPKPSNIPFITMEFAESLKRFRRRFNLTQKDVAGAVGMKPQVYQYYEAGTSVPSAAVIKKIAQTFSVSSDYLLGLVDEPRPAPDSEILLKALLGCRNLIQAALDEKIKSS